MGDSSSLRAARVAEVRFDRKSGACTMDGYTAELNSALNGSKPKTLSEFYTALTSDCANTLRSHLQEGDAEPLSLRLSFLDQLDTPTSFFMHEGDSDEQSRVFYIHSIADSSGDSSNPNSETALAKRGMAEAHHRIKNTLQNITSYINVLLAGRESLTKREAAKITRYIYSLSSLHDLILQQVKYNGEQKMIRLDSLLNNVIAVSDLRSSFVQRDIPELVTSPRQAATLGLILTELLNYTASNSTEALKLDVKKTNEERGELCLSFDRTDDDAVPNGLGSDELKVSKLVAKADLQSPLEMAYSGKHFTAKVSFPVLPNMIS